MSENKIKDIALPAVSICSLLLGIFLTLRGCSRDAEQEWGLRPQIQEQYYEVKSEQDWELDTAGVAESPQSLDDQLDHPIDRRHPVFQCRIATTEPFAMISFGRDQYWELLSPYVEQYYSEEIPKLVKESVNFGVTSGSAEGRLHKLAELKASYKERAKEYYSGATFIFLDLENIGARIGSSVVLWYSLVDVPPEDVYELAHRRKLLSDMEGSKRSIQLGELRPSDRLMVPLGIEVSFDLFDAMPQVPVGPVVVPERLEFIDKASGARSIIKIRGPLERRQYINSWIYGKG